jgi:hypothetical protein
MKLGMRLCSLVLGVMLLAATPALSASIYWGSYIEGQQTYTHYYGGTWTNAPWDANTWNKFEANAGKKVSIEHYGQPAPWVQPFAAGTANLVTARGAIPLIDMSSASVPLADIKNGVYDSSIIAWAQAVKAWGKPFFLRWNWEMNGTWFSWGAQAKANPADFVAAWRHFHDIVAAQGATNVTWVWCPNTEFTGSTPLEQLYPGDAYVDWTGIDGYNKSSSTYWISFYNLMKPTYDHLLRIAPNKPIMIAETGSREVGGSKAAWITDALVTQLPNNFPAVKAFVWFNWRIYEDGIWKEWPIESSAAATAAFAQGIASPYYAANNFGSLPPLTKVQPIGASGGSTVSAPAITSPTTASGTVGAAFGYQITASNSPTSYSATGLPAGLGVNAVTGLISGTPAASGAFSVTIGAANTGGKGTAVLALSIAPAPSATTIPAAPAGLTASVGGSSVSLAWTDRSNNETSFLIERKTGSGGTYAQIATVGANARTYTNSNLASRTTYYYHVRAANSAGNSAYSNEAVATTKGRR